MILKYIVPKKERKFYKNKKIVYCKILQEINMSNGMILYNTEMLNLGKRTNIFLNVYLKKLNLFDRIKLIKYNK